MKIKEGPEIRRLDFGFTSSRDIPLPRNATVRIGNFGTLLLTLII
jgi:hypothetical protein